MCYFCLGLLKFAGSSNAPGPSFLMSRESVESIEKQKQTITSKQQEKLNFLYHWLVNANVFVPAWVVNTHRQTFPFPD